MKQQAIEKALKSGGVWQDKHKLGTHLLSDLLAMNRVLVRDEKRYDLAIANTTNVINLMHGLGLLITTEEDLTNAPKERENRTSQAITPTLLSKSRAK